MNQQPTTNPYMWTVIALGVGVLAVSLFNVAPDALDKRFLILAVLTIVVGSRMTLKIERLDSHLVFSMSETFIFLVLLLHGGEAAILLASAEAFCSAWRFCKRKITVFFNAAVMACSTAAAVWTARAVFGDVQALARGGDAANFYVALCVLAIVHFAANTWFNSIYSALKNGRPLWQQFTTRNVLTSLTTFAGVVGAGALAKLVHWVGFYAVVATLPIIGLIFFTYRIYLKTIDLSLRQAEESAKHAAQTGAQAAALAASEEQFRTSFDYAGIGMALVTPEGDWLKVNRALCDIIGHDRDELLAGDFRSLAHEEDLGGALVLFDNLLKGRAQSSRIEMRFRHKDGHDVWTCCNFAAVRAGQHAHETDARDAHDGAARETHAGARITRLILQAQDITDRKRAEHRLRYDALHDALTGLPNRTLFAERLADATARAREDRSHRFDVLFIDLDRFKVINDSLGHHVGDLLLIEVARRLLTCVRRGDTVARMGGDEFTILLDGVWDADEAQQVAERVRQELARPFGLDSHEVSTSASIGIASSTEGYERAEDLMRDADTAMYHAKRAGKARHATFDRRMHDLAREALELETELRRAIESGEMRVRYQPIVRLDTNRIDGFEALVRWQHPTRGLVPPEKFVPVAEETGLIVSIDRWLFTEACWQTRAWQEHFADAEDFSAEPLSISINVSSRWLAQADFIEQIERTLAATHLDPRALRLEITESKMMENREGASAAIRTLRARGVRFSIDDFGSGYSSLSYLHRLPVSTIKIDRAFVGRVQDHQDDAEIVRTIVTLARSLRLKVVAEGIETEAQAARLRTLGCDYGQGYLYSEPVAPETATELLARPHADTSVVLDHAATNLM